MNRMRVVATVLAWSVIVVKYGSKGEPIYSVRELDQPADEAPGAARERIPMVRERGFRPRRANRG